jgi:hypothetical protein
MLKHIMIIKTIKSTHTLLVKGFRSITIRQKTMQSSFIEEQKGSKIVGQIHRCYLLVIKKNNRRFAHARNIQSQAEAKYGPENITTLGSSLGAKIAEKVGNKTKEVITLNKPTIPMDLIKGRKLPKNQTDIRTSRDPVSILRPFQKANNKEITIPSKTLNPFREHSTDVLSRMHEETLFGGGVRGKVSEACLYCD